MPRAPRAKASQARTDPLAKSDDNKSKKPTGTGKQATSSAATKDSTESKPASTLEESYLLLVRLVSSEEPTITRLLSVPSRFTFEQLHEVLQIAFGWAHCHAHSFTVSKLLEEGEEENWMTGCGEELLTLLPPIAADLGSDYPDPEKVKNAADYTLKNIYDGDEYRGKVEVMYEYDHGDSWEHAIVFLGHTDPTMRQAMQIPDVLKVVCIAGEGHPCAEDCGGAPGWENLKATFKKRGDPEGLKEWYKKTCANGDRKGLDPYKWDIFDVNEALSKVKW